jgi:hypothetical protein
MVSLKCNFLLGADYADSHPKDENSGSEEKGILKSILLNPLHTMFALYSSNKFYLGSSSTCLSLV